MEVPHLMSIRSMECWQATLNASSAIMSYAFYLFGSFRSQAWCGDFQFSGCGVLSSCNTFAFSGRNQAHNLTNIFHLNVLSNMLLEGSSARVLQWCPLPTDTGAAFNSFSKQSCLHTNCSGSPYLCPAGCFQENLFKQARTCHWNQLDFSDIPASWAHERTSLFINTGNGIRLCIFLVGCHPSDSHLAIQLVDYCKWLVWVASRLDF